MKNQKFNIILFALTAVVLSLLIPTNGMFRYNFKKGSNWGENTLYAPYDFPIHKTNKEYNDDIKSYSEDYKAVYHRDLSTQKRRLEEIASLLGIDSISTKTGLAVSQSQEDKWNVVAYNALKEIYRIGIIEASNNAPNGLVIRMVQNDTIGVYNRNKVLSIPQAKGALEEALANADTNEKYLILNDIDRYISPDIIYDEEIDNSIYNSGLNKISKVKGYVREGSVVINEGDVINEDRYSVLESYRQEHLKRGGQDHSILPFFGNLLFVTIVLVLSFFSLHTFDREFLQSTRNVLFLMVLYVSFMALARAISNFEIFPVSVYVIPFAIFPIYINNFFGSKISIYQYVFVLLIVSLLSTSSFEFLMMNYLAGVAGMYALQRAYKGGNLIRAIGVTLLTYAVLFTTLTFIEDGNFNNLEWVNYIWFFVNSVLLVVTYQLVYPIEKLFKFVSNVTLVELGDTNHKLLRELAMKAPGTFQHAMQVANLSEGAAKAIGANSLLARTGAMYHDIGKMNTPKCFIENNPGVSPHDKLSPTQSAEIIRNHVTNGLKLAKKSKLPRVITDFITAHHGNSLIYFFYKKQQDLTPDEEVDEKLFRYDGAPPHTKETTICMIADAAEAASRTLKEYTPESISELVERIVKGQQDNGAYVNSPLSYSEMEGVKKAIKDKLSNIYHARIEYPD